MYIVLSRKTLATPIGSSDDRLLVILRDHADELLRRRPAHKEEFVHQIERRLTELLPRGQARIKTFATIVERLRQDLASRYLAEDELTFTQIAFLLGYSNQSAFSVAYKRWTGKSPREGRANRRLT